ncbi:MAG: ATP-binding protein [Calditerrivibrio sp.]|nr:ATP-binding protein [Calditerrivibrio sp.]
MKKLPIGIQSFEEIRKDSYYYVDKTLFVDKLVNEGKYYFLSRPRRFGKSLFLDTLKQTFLGKKELFEGLYLCDKWDWGVSYPVVHIDFGGGVAKDESDLLRWIVQQMEFNYLQLGLNFSYSEDVRYLFNKLIIEAHKKYNQKVVVLIDEYDKPILDRLDNKDEAVRIREVLKNFYSVIKPLDAYVKFVFITGVSKFSKVSLFSGLNQLNDITLDEGYGTICGYTEGELNSVFEKELIGEDIDAIRSWYNGYSFLGESVYNPFDILLYLSKRKFHPYWFETGTPTFLIKLLVEKGFDMSKLEKLVAMDSLIGSFDVDFIEPENLLFQTGYLTIKGYEQIPTGSIYYLGYPNKEVKVSLNRYITGYLTQRQVESGRLYNELYDLFKRGDVGRIEGVIRALFSSIPYEWYRSNEISSYEGYYASVVYSFLSGAGFDMVAEDYTSKGRIDLTIMYDNRCYIIEFKVLELDGGGSALSQIKSKGYASKYVGRFDEIYLVGMSFSREEKNLIEFEWEKC